MKPIPVRVPEDSCYSEEDGLGPCLLVGALRAGRAAGLFDPLFFE